MAHLTQDQWNSIIEKTEPNCPSVGKTVRVSESKKHLGKVGKVFWHGVDKFDTTLRYCDTYQLWLRQAIGRGGYRIGIDTGTEKFFISADKVEVIQEVDQTA